MNRPIPTTPLPATAVERPEGAISPLRRILLMIAAVWLGFGAVRSVLAAFLGKMSFTSGILAGSQIPSFQALHALLPGSIADILEILAALAMGFAAVWAAGLSGRSSLLGPMILVREGLTEPEKQMRLVSASWWLLLALLLACAAGLLALLALAFAEILRMVVSVGMDTGSWASLDRYPELATRLPFSILPALAALLVLSHALCLRMQAASGGMLSAAFCFPMVCAIAAGMAAFI